MQPKNPTKRCSPWGSRTTGTPTSPAGLPRSAAHVLLALDLGMPATSFGRIHHLPAALLTELIDSMKARGLLEDEATFTPAGRQTKDRVEALTDALALAPYDILESGELDELISALEPLAQALDAAQKRA